MGGLIYGVGVYAEGPYQAKSGGRNTYVYDLWRGMLRRCYSPEAHRKQPAYIGCSVAPEFLIFQQFAAWAVTQIGFGYPRYHLDKDLLQPGNRIYGPDTCVFVPFDLNMFTTSNAAKRGQWPQGVSWKRKNRRFVAQIKTDGVVQYLGLFQDAHTAAAAYATAKTSAARRWASRLRAGEFVVDAKVIEALDAYEFKHKGV